MFKIGVSLRTLVDVSSFVRKVSLFDYPVEVEQNDNRIDAKSLAGVLSLDTDRILMVVCHTYDKSILNVLSSYTLSTTLEEIY